MSAPPPLYRIGAFRARGPGPTYLHGPRGQHGPSSPKAPAQLTLDELKSLCADRGLFVVGAPYGADGDRPGVVVRARADNSKLRDLPPGLSIRPSGPAYTVIEIIGVPDA